MANGGDHLATKPIISHGYYYSIIDNAHDSQYAIHKRFAEQIWTAASERPQRFSVNRKAEGRESEYILKILHVLSSPYT